MLPFLSVFKAQFLLASIDMGKNIKREDMMKVMKVFGQNPQPHELDAALKENKFETKTHLTFDEGHKVAQHLWTVPVGCLFNVFFFINYKFFFT
jgi:hypothetical protein